MSFGEEAEEDEEQSTRENEKFVGKGKSTHDVLGKKIYNLFYVITWEFKDDPKLSSKTEEVESDENEEADPEEQLQNIRKKLKREHKKPIPVATTTAEPLETYESYLEEERQEKKKKQLWVLL